MSGTFEIHIDPRRKLLRMRLDGFFSTDDVADYVVAKNAALRQMNCGRNQHFTLCDVSNCKLQSQDVVAEFQHMLGDPRYMSRRIAFVTGSSLARMQVRRLLARGGAACFSTVREAETWLFAEESTSPSPRLTPPPATQPSPAP